MIRPCLAPPGRVLNGLSATPDWRGGNTRAGAHEHVDTKIDGELRLQVAHEPCQRPSQGPLLPGVSSHGPCIALSMLPPTGGRSSQARCLSLRPALGSPPASSPWLLLPLLGRPIATIVATVVDSYLQRGVVCAAASPRSPPFNDCPHCRRSARSTGGSRGGCLSLLLAMLTGRSTPADRARRLSQTTLSLSLILCSYLIVDRRDKIRLLGFTTLHPTRLTTLRNSAMPGSLTPRHLLSILR